MLLFKETSYGYVHKNKNTEMVNDDHFQPDTQYTRIL